MGPIASDKRKVFFCFFCNTETLKLRNQETKKPRNQYTKQPSNQTPGNSQESNKPTNQDIFLFQLVESPTPEQTDISYNCRIHFHDSRRCFPTIQFMINVYIIFLAGFVFGESVNSESKCRAAQIQRPETAMEPGISGPRSETARGPNVL